jgi:hypothetical protein
MSESSREVIALTSQARITYPVTSDDCRGINVQTDHVTCIQESEVLANGVHPDALLVLWVSHTDVPGDTLGEVHPRPVAHHCGHVDEKVATVLVMVGESWNACS